MQPCIYDSGKILVFPTLQLSAVGPPPLTEPRVKRLFPKAPPRFMHTLMMQRSPVNNIGGCVTAPLPHSLKSPTMQVETPSKGNEGFPKIWALGHELPFAVDLEPFDEERFFLRSARSFAKKCS